MPHGVNAFRTFAVGYEEEIDKDYEAQRPSGISSTRSRMTKQGADDDPFSTPPPGCDGIRPPFVSGLGVAVFAHVTGFGKAARVTTEEGSGWVRVAEVPRLVGLWVMRRGTTESA